MAVSRRAVGLGVLGLGVGGTAAIALLTDGFGGGTAQVELWGFVGGEKMAFVGNPEVVERLQREHGITLDARRAGSVEMVRDPSLTGQNPDFLWPASGILVELAKASGVRVRQDGIVFNSPIVLYTWLPIAEALRSSGLVEERGGAYYLTAPKDLFEAAIRATDWSEFGLDQLYNGVAIVSTDPSKSNSGFTFAGLAETVLDGDDEAVRALFGRMGYKPYSSGKLWNSFLNEGMGGNPIIVGYESQLIDYIINEPDRWQRLAGSDMRPVIIYPEPTVYASHPVISLTEAADPLVAALRDDDVLLELAWRQHGFRGPAGSADPSALAIDFVPDALTKIVRMPEASRMLALVDLLVTT